MTLYSANYIGLSFLFDIRYDYRYRWMINFNVKKPKCMVARKAMLTSQPTLCIGDTVLDKEPHLNIFGTVISGGFSFNEHV